MSTTLWRILAVPSKHALCNDSKRHVTPVSASHFFRSFETVECTNNDWHHSYPAQFPDPFQLPLQVLVVLNFVFLFVFHLNVKMTGNINYQAHAFYFIQYHNVRLVVFTLVVGLYLKFHRSLLLVDWYTACGSWFFHSCHNPTFHKGPNESSAPPCRASKININCFWASFLHSDTIWLTVSSPSTFYWSLQTHFAFWLSSTWYY